MTLKDKLNRGGSYIKRGFSRGGDYIKSIKTPLEESVKTGLDSGKSGLSFLEKGVVKTGVYSGKAGVSLLKVSPKVFDVTGKTILFPFYLTGVFPFTRIPENEYQMTRYLTRHRGPALKGPGTSWYLRPIISKVKDAEGKIEIVDGKIQERDSSFKFRTRDGMEGNMIIQCNVRIPNKGCAKRFYWDIGKKMTLVDEVVLASVSAKIGGIQADDLVEKSRVYCNEVVEELSKEDKKNLLYGKYGVIVTNIAMKEFDFTQDSQEILATVKKAEQEAKEAEILSNVTFKMAKKYVETAKVYNKADPRLSIGETALRLKEEDDRIRMATNSNIHAIIIGRETTPIIPLVDYHPTESDSTDGAYEAEFVEHVEEPEQSPIETQTETSEEIYSRENIISRLDKDIEETQNKLEDILTEKD